MTRQLDIAARVHAYVPEHNAGAETMLHTMLRALTGRGHRCTVWLARYSEARDEYQVDGVRVFPLRAPVTATPVEKSDVVISHLENVDSTAAIAKGFGLPYIVLAHNTFYPTQRAIEKAQPALVVYNSNWMWEKTGGHVNGIVVHPPVYPADYATTPGDSVTLINATVTKGAGTLFALAARYPQTTFLAVGGAYGIQEHCDLPNVEFLEHVPFDQMRDKVYARTRVLLMPSDYESWGRVGVEALASGIPVMAHPTPGLTESLGKAGIFNDRADIDAWAADLKPLLDNEKTYSTASRKAKKRSDELDPLADLERWCDAVEALVT